MPNVLFVFRMACSAAFVSASARFFAASLAKMAFVRSKAVIGFGKAGSFNTNLGFGGVRFAWPPPPGDGFRELEPRPIVFFRSQLGRSPTPFPGPEGPAAVQALCCRSKSYLFSSAISASVFATRTILGAMPGQPRAPRGVMMSGSNCESMQSSCGQI